MLSAPQPRAQPAASSGEFPFIHMWVREPRASGTLGPRPARWSLGEGKVRTHPEDGVDWAQSSGQSRGPLQSPLKSEADSGPYRGAAGL